MTPPDKNRKKLILGKSPQFPMAPIVIITIGRAEPMKRVAYSVVLNGNPGFNGTGEVGAAMDERLNIL